MAAGIAVAAGAQTIHLFVNSFPRLRTTRRATPTLLFSPSFKQIGTVISAARRRKPSRRRSLTVCFVLEDEKLKADLVTSADENELVLEKQISAARLAEKLARKRSERFTYLVAAVMSSFGITSMAVMAVYYRFSWQMEVC